MAKPNRSIAARSAQQSTISNPFARKSLHRLRTNLALLSSIAADQSLIAGRLNVPKVAAELQAISARLENISYEIGGGL